MTSPEGSALGTAISNILSRLQELESSVTVAQLPSSSVQATSIPFLDSEGNVAATIGSTGVLLTDPNGMAQSTFDTTGAVNSNSVNIINDLNYRGQELTSVLDAKMTGLIAWAYFTDGDTPATPVGSGIAQIDFNVTAGRAYEINCAPVVIRASSGAANSTTCSVELRYTSDGTNPLTTSPLLQSVPGQDSDGLSPRAFFFATSTAPIKVLLAFTDTSATTQYAECNTTHPIAIWVNELAVVAPPSTGRRTAGTLSGVTPQQYVKTYSAMWSRTWSAQGIQNGINLVQGNYSDSFGDWKSLFGFDYTTIAADLSGSTIQKAELFLYCSYSINNDGAYARLRTTPLQTAPANNLYPISASSTRLAWKFSKPGSYWIDLGTTIGNEIQAGTTASFALDATDINPRNNADGGWWNSAIASGNIPQLRITYVK